MYCRDHKSLGKPWEFLDTVGLIPRYLERAEAVARVGVYNHRIYNFFGVYLHWLGLAADKFCPLCGHARVDGNHLLQCPGLDEYPMGGSTSNSQEAKHGRWINK
ncbi:reverse transcriptase [Trichonephila clavipes]|nr:reverse transcriptase [Trichonephila clavipes]